VKVGVVVFPGTNCEQDIENVYGRLLKAETARIWHRDTTLPNVDVVVLPGGFSYGDYLRTGALARLSPVMEAIKGFAAAGGKVIGICNGFQIQNVGRRFLSRFVHLKVDSNSSFFTSGMDKGAVFTCPIAHFQGNYFADSSTINELEANNQVVFRYCSSSGERRDNDREVNVNGSINSIAGITNRAGNVVGLMPHPERSVEAITGFIGGKSGLEPFKSSLAL